MSRGMVEAFFVDYDSDVRQTAEENHVAKLELFAFGRRAERRPVRTRGSALKIYADVLERPPNQSRTIECLGTGAIEVVSRANVRFKGDQQLIVKALLESDGVRQLCGRVFSSRRIVGYLTRLRRHAGGVVNRVA